MNLHKVDVDAARKGGVILKDRPDVRQRLRTAAPGTLVTLTLGGAEGTSRDVAVTLREMVNRP